MNLFQTANNPLQYLQTPVPVSVPVSASPNAGTVNVNVNADRHNVNSIEGIADEDEERADPSFNVLEAIVDMDALDDDLREELRSDRGTRVSKRELNELLAEYYALTQGDQENAIAYPQSSAASVPRPPDGGHTELLGCGFSPIHTTTAVFHCIICSVCSNRHRSKLLEQSLVPCWTTRRGRGRAVSSPFEQQIPN